MNRGGHLNPMRSQWTHGRTDDGRGRSPSRRTMIEPVFVTPRPVYHNQHFCKLFRESYFRGSFTLTKQLVRRFLLLHPMMVMESWAAIFVQTHPNARFGLPALSSQCRHDRSCDRPSGRASGRPWRSRRLSPRSPGSPFIQCSLERFLNPRTAGGEAGKALHTPGT